MNAEASTEGNIEWDMNKRDVYEQLAATLGKYNERDALMCDHDPDTWQQARDLDDWLVTHREDDTPLGEYRMKCLKLRALYETWKALTAPPVAAGGRGRQEHRINNL